MGRTSLKPSDIKVSIVNSNDNLNTQTNKELWFKVLQIVLKK